MTIQINTHVDSDRVAYVPGEVRYPVRRETRGWSVLQLCAAITVFRRYTERYKHEYVNRCRERRMGYLQSYE